MRLIDMIQIAASKKSINAEDFSYLSGLSPVNSYHPPSLQNPTPVPQEMPSDGWHYGDSYAARAKAIADMMVILERAHRQGQPNMYQTTPMNPSLWRNFISN